MPLGDQVALQEALGKQQHIHSRRVRLPGEFVDDAQGGVHVAEDFRRLARTDPHLADLSAGYAYGSQVNMLLRAVLEHVYWIRAAPGDSEPPWTFRHFWLLRLRSW